MLLTLHRRVKLMSSSHKRILLSIEPLEHWRRWSSSKLTLVWPMLTWLMDIGCISRNSFPQLLLRYWSFWLLSFYGQSYGDQRVGWCRYGLSYRLGCMAMDYFYHWCAPIFWTGHAWIASGCTIDKGGIEVVPLPSRQRDTESYKGDRSRKRLIHI